MDRHIANIEVSVEDIRDIISEDHKDWYIIFERIDNTGNRQIKTIIARNVRTDKYYEIVYVLDDDVPYAEYEDDDIITIDEVELCCDFDDKGQVKLWKYKSI